VASIWSRQPRSAAEVARARLLAYALDEKITSSATSPRPTARHGTIAQVCSSSRASYARHNLPRARPGQRTAPARDRASAASRAGRSLNRAKGTDSARALPHPFALPGGDQTRPSRSVQSRRSSRSCAWSMARPNQIRVYAQAREFDAKTRDALTRCCSCRRLSPTRNARASRSIAERQQIVRSRRDCARTRRVAQLRPAAPLPRHARQAGERA